MADFAGSPGDAPAVVAFIDEDDSASLLSPSDWLALLATDELIDLPLPAAAYLTEARGASEV